MTGSDKRRRLGGRRTAREAPPAPAIILVEPQLGENIGTTARAMLNCGLTDLRLVRPRDGWPNFKAERTAAGADEVISNARVFDDVRSAASDLHRLYATTARNRYMVHEIHTARTSAPDIRRAAARGQRVGILFGRERTGLENDDLSLADAVITLPLNPGFSSLNLAQAVLIVGYEWYLAGDGGPAPEGAAERGTGSRLHLGAGRPATKDQLFNFFAHLEQELDASGFLRLDEKRPGMVQNIRNLFQRARPTDKEIKTLHGIVTGLAWLGRQPARLKALGLLGEEALKPPRKWPIKRPRLGEKPGRNHAPPAAAETRAGKSPGRPGGSRKTGGKGRKGRRFRPDTV